MGKQYCKLQIITMELLKYAAINKAMMQRLIKTGKL